MIYESNKFAFIDLATKILTLKPEFIGQITSDRKLIDRVINFSQQLADAVPPETHEYAPTWENQRNS
jgi:hypothetical protein